MVRGAIVIGLTLTLASCGVARNIGGAVTGGSSPRGANSININGTTFRSKLDIGGPQKRDMTITVRPVAVDPRGAQEAGRYRATVYCLRKFGSSATEWTVGPDLPPDQIAISEDDATTLRGSCIAR